MDYLEQPVNEQVIVTSVGLDTPAQDKLRAGDEILAVDGVDMTTPEQVVDAVRSKPIGTDLNFSIVRSGSKLEVVVTSSTRPDDPATEQDEATIPYIGIGIDINYSAEFDIDFGVTGVGGPSAGMMFAVGIIDKLTPGALTQGKIIAGTGTIDPDGNVGEIGGIQQKLTKLSLSITVIRSPFVAELKATYNENKQRRNRYEYCKSFLQRSGV
jgi:PDZ domain-containing protein